MSVPTLQRIVGKAVISDQFRAGLLNGQRGQLISGYDLEPDEVAEIMAIRANSLQEFAAAMESIVDSRETPRLVKSWASE